jgi:hypothetical protein
MEGFDRSSSFQTTPKYIKQIAQMKRIKRPNVSSNRHHTTANPFLLPYAPDEFQGCAVACDAKTSRTALKYETISRKRTHQRPFCNAEML